MAVVKFNLISSISFLAALFHLVTGAVSLLFKIMDNHADIIIVGAGLSGLMTAWRCLDMNPDLTATVIEASDRIAGDHTWSFNLTDVTPQLRDWIAPFIAHQWPQYDVKFPKRKRTLDITYCTGNSDTLRACVQTHIDSGRLKVILNTSVDALMQDHVVTSDEDVHKADCVMDARGFKPNDNVFLGYQKFVGHVIRTAKPHGLKNPIIMDATVEQLGGYRFVYCLPYSDTEVLVEDTYYTDGPELRSQEVDARIKDYIRDNLGVSEYEVLRRERGVLPITLAVDSSRSAERVLRLGIGGGHYHAVTGYSLPNAVRLADQIATQINTPTLAISAAHYHHISSEKFLRLLNRMLFRAAKPTERYSVLERFYGLNQGLIKRFYAGTLTWRDKARILIGKPPVPVHKALYNLSESAFIKRMRQNRDKP